MTDQSKNMRRVAVIDVGSNSVRLVIFDGASRSPAYFFNEKVMAGLGSDLVETGRLNPEGCLRALAALRRFAALCASIEAPIMAVATAALREAEDGPEFREQVLRETGIELHIIDGPEEGRLSANGILLAWPEADGVVCDIGGSSMEIARLTLGHVGQSLTSKLGPLRLRAVPEEERSAYIEAELDRLEPVGGRGMDRLWLVGGSFRAIAKYDMARRDYPLKILNEYRTTPSELMGSMVVLRKGGPEELRDKISVSSNRAKLTPFAAEVLEALIARFQPYEVVFSSFGLREGLLYKAMPEALRRRDPLIEAARALEASMARIAGFGERLYALLMPLFRHLPSDKLRLIRAACLLHDINWRAHPETRSETGFEAIARANLAGLTHEHRIFLSLCVYFRYTGKKPSQFKAITSLLRAEDFELAEAVGRAMRFGALFWIKSPGEPGYLDVAENVLQLHLSVEGAVLFGEVAEARLNALGKAMGLDVQVLGP